MTKNKTQGFKLSKNRFVDKEMETIVKKQFAEKQK